MLTNTELARLKLALHGSAIYTFELDAEILPAVSLYCDSGEVSWAECENTLIRTAVYWPLC